MRRRTRKHQEENARLSNADTTTATQQNQNAPAKRPCAREDKLTKARMKAAAAKAEEAARNTGAGNTEVRNMVVGNLGSISGPTAPLDATLAGKDKDMGRKHST